MHARDIPSDTPTLFVVPWGDPVIDTVGYDPRAVYVERFWLGILGPTRWSELLGASGVIEVALQPSPQGGCGGPTHRVEKRIGDLDDHGLAEGQE